ncbi:hypothetical protein CVT26_004185 [Gymnopilus dilepis]|uniref:Restriction of telomere capping protein 4 C-terminal domain-containing protein n=1 Tax=Gymnopilus dilepis TaxID=231916 RepID=A0A409WN26_9AGAR|nr:hypothetical protein CVT26_004185 [Gymnopilus dilepis]
MNQPLDHPDPVFTPLQICPGNGKPCGKPMKTLAVYKGAGSPSKKNLRGSLFQSCTDYNCLFTVHYTPAYDFDDATRLLNRIHYPGDPSGYPRTLRPPSNVSSQPGAPPPSLPAPAVPPMQPPFTPSQSLPPPVATLPAQQPTSIPNSTTPPIFSTVKHVGKILCARADCQTQSGARTQGSKLCIEGKCKKCCNRATKEAVSTGQARRSCTAHGQPEVLPHPSGPAQPQIALPPSLPNTITPNGSAAAPTGPPAAPASIPITASRATSEVPISSDPTAPSTQHSTAPLTTTLPKRAVANSDGQIQVGQGRSLARPLKGPWAKELDSEKPKQSLRSLKIQEQEMDERKKRTCVIVLYFENGKPPVRISHYIPSLPFFQLSASPQLVSDLGLRSTSRLDLWQGEWTTVTIDDVVRIEQPQRVLLKLRPNLLESLEDCPEIEDELQKQPRFFRGGMKRPASETFVSPVRSKVRRTVSPPPSPMTISEPKSFEPTTYGATSLEKVKTADVRHSNALISGSEPRSDGLAKLPMQLQPGEDGEDMKKWPFDYKVYQIHNGLIQIRKTLKAHEISQSMKRSHSRKSLKKGKVQPKYSITMKDAFFAAFPDAEAYHKSTFYDHRDLFEGYDKRIVHLFIDLGDSKKATYKHLVKALKDARHVPSPEATSESDSDSGNDSESDSDTRRSSSGPHGKAGRQNPSRDEDQYEPSACSSPSANAPISLASVPDLPDPSFTSSPTPEMFQRRIQDLKDLLEEILMEPSESQHFYNARASFNAGSSKNHTKLTTVLNDCIMYYGSAIHMAIVSELEKMFPSGSFDMGMLMPLTWDAVIQEFLFPEAVLLLIQDDLRISMPQALEILRKKRVVDKRIKAEPADGQTRQPLQEPTTIINLYTPSPSPQRAIKLEPDASPNLRSQFGEGKGKAKVKFPDSVEIIDLTFSDDD